jgi:hypothetical protein
MPDATERRAVWLCSFVGGCIALGPMEWVSAGVLLFSALMLFLAHRSITKREDALLQLLDGWVPPPGAPPAPAASLEAARAKGAEVAAPLEM